MEMVSRKDGNPEIDPMREPRKHALLRDWNSFKDYFQSLNVGKWLLSKKELGIEKVALFAYEGVEPEKEGNATQGVVEPQKEGNEKDENYRLNCLQLLSRMPSVFRSHNSQAGFAYNLIYVCLPNKGYDDEDENEEDNDVFIKSKEDLESGKNNTKKFISPSASLPSKDYDDIDNDDRLIRGGGKRVKKSISASAVPSIIYYAIWKLVANEIWKRKQKNKHAKEVADFLVNIDNSWRKTNHGNSGIAFVLPVIQPSNVAATKKALLEKTNSFLKPLKCNDYTPLLLAASTGIVEIVEKIIDEYPDAISHVSQHDEQNVLHVAVKHRQKKIFKLLKKYKVLKGLGTHIASHDRTLLHQVARMDYYDGGNNPGVVFQLQEELRWFERVRKIVPCHYQLYCNEDKLTARELFNLEHSEMLKEAQQWIKETAQSCSAVSVLVATVVFAAAYTVPGGTDDTGVPVLLNSPLFLFFTIMDVVGLASSLVSVMMFLSILTSPFQMQEFYKSLPRKLTMGFTLLFISLTSTMLAFGSTILLTIRMDNKKWSSSLIYSITFFPVTLFELTQFPIIMAVKYRVKRLWKNLKKLIPKSKITLSKKPTRKRDYSKYL